MFVIIAHSQGLPKGLLESVCWVESKYNVEAIHKDDGKGNSVGICQVKLATAQWLGFKGTEKELMEPATNAYYSAKYLKHQLLVYNNDIPRAITAYNRGNAKGLTHSAYSDKVIKKWRKI